MGRHGGGSSGGGRSGGGGGGRSSGGSRSGGSGSSTRSATKPFSGSYNRSYRDRFGRFHTYYTTNSNFGKSPMQAKALIPILLFVTIHMLIMVSSVSCSTVSCGTKVHGDESRIYISDKIDLLTESEEEHVLDVFRDVYKKSGMPVALYTDDYSWRERYTSLEVYSEELYYKRDMSEDAMVIVFTADYSMEYFDWEYDMYCGDDTIKCFSDKAFDKLLNNFQKAMAQGNLTKALDYSWSSVMGDLAKTTIEPAVILPLLFFFMVYGMFYALLLPQLFRSQDAYKYFKENPEELSDEPIVIYNKCPSCGADNSTEATQCPYCGSLLLIQKGNTQYVPPGR